MARTSQVLRQGSNASDAVLLVHRILRVLSYIPHAPLDTPILGRPEASIASQTAQPNGLLPFENQSA